MNWFRRWFRRSPVLSAEELSAIAAYQALPGPPSAQALQDARFVVLDVETSGLNPYRDRLLSIGAIAVHNGTIHVRDAFEAVLRQDIASDHQNILVHGIDGTTQLSGRDARAVLLDFIGYAGNAPVVGYHVDFDRITIERAVQRMFGLELLNDWVDLARIVPALFPDQASRGNGLDYWLSEFSIENFARHDAMADALAAAQLLLVAMSQAASAGVANYGALKRLDEECHWLARNQPTLR
jgi:DNA polymerase-3 subunit epsilon